MWLTPSTSARRQEREPLHPFPAERPESSATSSSRDRSPMYPSEQKTTTGSMETMIRAAHQHFASTPRSSSSSSSHVSEQVTPRPRKPLSSRADPASPRTRTDNNNAIEQVSSPPPPSSFDDPDAYVALTDHMESFPLVPLPIIPRLSFADLRKCEDGLLQLLRSLSPDTPDDVHLGKYANRQLSLVQRHVEQARARERVLQLLRGDIPTAIAPSVHPSASALRSGISQPLPIFLTPAAATVAVNDQQAKPPLKSTHPPSSKSDSSKFSAPLVASPSAKSPVSKVTAKKKKDAIEAARALIKASMSATGGSTVSSFVISAGDHSSSNSNRRRRKRQLVPKQTREEQEKTKAMQLEREREKRRQEAYQRLVARQNLQAAKRKTKKDSQANSSSNSKASDNCARTTPASATDPTIPSDPSTPDRLQSSGGPEGGNAASDTADDGAASCSSESDVSNCSDSDEENEKAIMALEVTAKVDDDGWVDEEDDDGQTEAEAASAAQTDDMGDVGDSEEEECEPLAAAQEQTDRDQAGFVVGQANSSESPEVEDDKDEAMPEDVAVAPLAVHDANEQELQRDSETEGEEQKRIQAQQVRVEKEDQEQQIARALLEFMSSRKTAMMEQMQQQKQSKMSEVPKEHAPSMPSSVTTRPHSTGPFLNQESEQIEPDRLERSAKCPWNGETVERDPNTKTETAASSLQPADTSEAKSVANSNPSGMSATHMPRPTANLASQQQNQVNVSTVHAGGIPRAPTKGCKDYRPYFSTFQCILTSAFEQRHALTANASSSSSRESLIASQVQPRSDQSLRLQLKLYEGWQSIMQDYATVFGGNIATPSSIMPSLSSSTAHYRINSTTRREVCDIVITALDKLGDWEEHPSGLGLKTTWNLLWTWSKPRVERKTLLAWQKVNHFQHAKALTRKDCLKKNMGKYLAMGGKMKQTYDVIPLTFILPQEYIAFVQAYQDKNARLKEKNADMEGGKNIWIMKPVALSRGRGISLINDLSQVVYGEQVVIQEYIANPLLLDGYKFDLRLYVLVTSFNPLEAFFYEEGFVRMCTRQYEDSDLSNLFVHLTNSSIQKENQDAIQTSDNPINAAAGEEAGGTKMTLAYLWKRLEAMGADVDKVKSEIIEVILKSLMCGEDHIPFQVNSFDLYGYDILLDDTFRPWLIEINSSPSMARENDLDYQVKDALILDTIKLVNPLRFDRAKFVDIVSRRLQDLDNEKKRPHAHIRHPKQSEELAIRQLNEDLTEILNGEVPRNFGDMPAHLGSYRRICPHTTSYNQLVKLKKSCVRMERKVA